MMVVPTNKFVDGSPMSDVGLENKVKAAAGVVEHYRSYHNIG